MHFQKKAWILLLPFDIKCFEHRRPHYVEIYIL